MVVNLLYQCWHWLLLALPMVVMGGTGFASVEVCHKDEESHWQSQWHTEIGSFMGSD